MALDQRNVKLAGFGLGVFLLVVPPWHYVVDMSQLKVSRPGPHAFLLDPPDLPQGTPNEANQELVYGIVRNRWSVEIDGGRLVLELLVVAAGTGLILFATRGVK